MRNTVIILFILSACTHKVDVVPAALYKTIESTDTSLHFVNGKWYQSKELLSAAVITRYPDNRVQYFTNYKAGQEEGWKRYYYPDSLLAEKRFYHLGEKDSIHLGWWPNRKLRFEYHFTRGVYNGDFKEWYSSGNKYKQIHYANGIEDWAQGWRENGKLYMNFVVKNGRRYGIENSNLCYTVKNEKGEYVKSQ